MLRRESEICSVASLCLLFSMAEYLIPKPLPFCKLGLANLPLLLILSTWDWKSYLLVVLLKGIGSLCVGGTLFSPIALISLCGGFASAVMMKGIGSLARGHISLLGISVLGALSSNLAQIGTASLLVYGTSIWLVAPLLCAIGFASSLILAILANSCHSHGLFPSERALPSLPDKKGHPLPFFLLLATLLLLLFEKEPKKLASVWLLLLMAQKAAGKRIRLAYPLMLLCSLLFLSLFTPTGTILWSWGPFSLGTLSLYSSLQKGLRLICMVTLSQSLVVLLPPLHLGFFRMLSLTLSLLGTYEVPHKGMKVKEIVSSLFSPREKEKVNFSPSHPKLISLFAILSLCVLAL